MTKVHPRWYFIFTIVVFTIIAIGMYPNLNATFAIAYGFGILSILTAWYSFNLTLKRGKNAKSKFYGFPILRVGGIYLIVQIVLSILSMSFSDVLAPVVATPIYFLVFVVAAVGLSSTTMARDEIKRLDIELKIHTHKMRAMQSFVSSLPGACSDADLKKQVQKLSENIRCSDPVTHPSLETIENSLTQCLEELKTAIYCNDVPTAQAYCKRAQELLSERNRLCKLNK